MKSFLLVLVNFIFIREACSQTIIKIDIGDKKTVSKVDVTGANVDNDSARRKFIIDQLSASKFVSKGAKKGTYTVIVYMLVEKDGSIVDVRCKNNPGYGMCEESISAIKRSPTSIPHVPKKVWPLKPTYIADSSKKQVE